MITTREDLNQCLNEEKNLYFTNDPMRKSRLMKENRFYIYRYVRALRFAEYHRNCSRRNRRFHRFSHAFWRRRKNRRGRKLGIEIWENSFEPGLLICHCGSIVINGNAKVGRDCTLRGDNCIGNDGKTPDSPVIGDRVQLGNGAKIIGSVTIADDITIAAGAVVVDSFTEPGVTIGGIPAKVIGK